MCRGQMVWTQEEAYVFVDTNYLLIQILQIEEYSFESDQPKLRIWQAMSHEVASCEPVASDKGCTQMARTQEVTCMLRHISHFE